MTSISLPGASGSCFVRSVFTCWACVAVANPKVKINTERISFFMLCIASVLSVMCCDNRLNRSCVADTHAASNPLDRREEEVTRWTKRSVVFGGHTQDPPSSKVELSIPGPSIAYSMERAQNQKRSLGNALSILISCLLFGRETHASTTQSDPLLLPTRNGPCRKDGAPRLEYPFCRVQHPPP